MVINRGKYSSYFMPLYCDTCGKLTNSGEVIPAKYLDVDEIYGKRWRYAFICPKCYLLWVKIDKTNKARRANK